jgi:ATP synthase protein I
VGESPKGKYTRCPPDEVLFRSGPVFWTLILMPFNRPIPDSKPRPRISSGLASLVEAEKMMQIAVLLPSSAFVGWLIGAWLDKTLHQSWISLAGILLGGISGLVYVVRLVISVKSNPPTKPGPGNSSLKP